MWPADRLPDFDPTTAFSAEDIGVGEIGGDFPLGTAGALDDAVFVQSQHGIADFPRATRLFTGGIFGFGLR